MHWKDEKGINGAQFAKMQDYLHWNVSKTIFRKLNPTKNTEYFKQLYNLRSSKLLI